MIELAWYCEQWWAFNINAAALGSVTNICYHNNNNNLICSYNTIKTWIQGGNTKKPLGPTLHMVAAAQAGILTLVMTNPIWVVKTRLCLQYSEVDKTRLPESKRYLGMTDALGKIYYNEGIRGLYKVCVIMSALHSELYFSKSVFIIKYLKLLFQIIDIYFLLLS
jgi:hypothetical protein